MPVKPAIPGLDDLHAALRELHRIDPGRAAEYVTGSALNVRAYVQALRKSKLPPTDFTKLVREVIDDSREILRGLE